MYTALGDPRVCNVQNRTSACAALPFQCWGLDTAVADAVQVLLEGVGEKQFKFPSITQTNFCLGTSMNTLWEKNSASRVRHYHLETPLEAFVLTAGCAFIHSSRHSKVLWKHKRPLNPEDEAIAFMVDVAEIFLQRHFIYKAVFVHFDLFVTKELHFIGELTLSDILIASFNVNGAIHFATRKARYVATAEGYNKSVMVSTCC